MDSSGALRLCVLGAVGIVFLCGRATSQEIENVHQQCNQTIYEGRGLIASPNFPRVYEKDLHCSWSIVVEYGRTVMLQFRFFDVERSMNCQYDRLTVYNGPSDTYPILGRFCGPFLPGQLVSTSNKMLVVFETDSSKINVGFLAIFVSADPEIATPDSCGGLLTGPEGSFHSPNYPKSDYTPATTCSWNIRTTPDRYIILTFDDFQLEKSPGCKYDSVAIYGKFSDSDQTRLLGRLCGGLEELPSAIESDGNEMFVTFVSDTSGFASGFLANYATKVADREIRPKAPTAICTHTVILKSPEGEFTSPAYGTGVEYGNDLACSWRIIGPEGTRVRLRVLDFRLEKDFTCILDYVAVYSGSSERSEEIGRFCGSLVERTLISNGNEMFVQFHTDSEGGESGFRIAYDTIPQGDTRQVSVLSPTTASLPTTATTTVPLTTTSRPTSVFFECPTRCPPRIKLKSKICKSNYVLVVKLTDIARLKSQSIAPVQITQAFKQGSVASETTNLRIMCRRCSSMARKGYYLIAGDTVTHEGIELRPGDLAVRYKSRKHTRLITKYMNRCRVRRHPRKPGKKQKTTRGKKGKRSSKKKSKKDINVSSHQR